MLTPITKGTWQTALKDHSVADAITHAHKRNRQMAMGAHRR